MFSVIYLSVLLAIFSFVSVSFGEEKLGDKVYETTLEVRYNRELSEDEISERINKYLKEM